MQEKEGTGDANANANAIAIAISNGQTSRHNIPTCLPLQSSGQWVSFVVPLPTCSVRTPALGWAFDPEFRKHFCSAVARVRKFDDKLSSNLIDGASCSLHLSHFPVPCTICIGLLGLTVSSCLKYKVVEKLDWMGERPLL